MIEKLILEYRSSLSKIENVKHVKQLTKKKVICKNAKLLNCKWSLLFIPTWAKRTAILEILWLNRSAFQPI